MQFSGDGEQLTDTVDRILWVVYKMMGRLRPEACTISTSVIAGRLPRYANICFEHQLSMVLRGRSNLHMKLMQTAALS